MVSSSSGRGGQKRDPCYLRLQSGRASLCVFKSFAHRTEQDESEQVLSVGRFDFSCLLSAVGCLLSAVGYRLSVFASALTIGNQFMNKSRSSQMSSLIRFSTRVQLSTICTQLGLPFEASVCLGFQMELNPAERSDTKLMPQPNRGKQLCCLESCAVGPAIVCSGEQKTSPIDAATEIMCDCRALLMQIHFHLFNSNKLN